MNSVMPPYTPIPQDQDQIFKLIKEISNNPMLKNKLSQLLLENTNNSNNEPKMEESSSLPSDSESDSESEEAQSQGNLVERVRLGLATMSTKISKKKTATKKRWWTPEEVTYILSPIKKRK